MDDLAEARAASQRLRGAAEGTAPPRGATGFIRFSAAAFTPSEALANPFGPAVWNEMLDRCMREARAEVCFVTDAHGLVVASRGAMDAALIEGIGARLLIAFEQADQMTEGQTPSGSIAIEMGHRWLTGFRVRRELDRIFTVGVLGPSVVSRELRGALEGMLV
ncbi:MAG: hypothetical protein U0359_01315, partial [Byssovorax sp.]